MTAALKKLSSFWPPSYFGSRNQKSPSLLKKIVDLPLGQIAETFTIISNDTLSLAKDIETIQKGENSFIQYGGLASANVGLLLGMNDFRRGIVSHLRAQEIKDEEGKRRSKAKLFSSSLLIAGSSTFVTEKIAEVAGASLGAAIGHVAQGFFGVGSVFAMGMSTLGLTRCYRFRKRIDERLENSTLSKEDRYYNALSYLLSIARPTPEEISEIQKQIPFSQKNREEAVEKAIQERGEVKANYFKRRSSSWALERLLKEGDSLCQDLRKPSMQKEALLKAEALIEEIKGQNKRKMALFSISMLTASLALTAIILGTFFSFGILPILLYIISSTIYLGMGIYSLVHHRFAKEVADQQGVSQPLDAVVPV